ncbi:MAG TPA: molybdopterin-dependent oxidoreductase [Marmoricola sp.]|nr:molybdopterin-dependent oxidoreductase [Marmoricola sp.]
MTTTGVSSTPSRSRLERALAGVLAGAAGLAVSLAVTSLLRLRLTPPNAVAEAVIEITPGKVALELVHLLGRWDKPLLLAGVLVALVVLSAVAGLLTARSRWLGPALFLLMAVLAGTAALTRPGAASTDVVPVMAGFVTWVGVLTFLTAPLTTPPTASSDGPRSRRRGQSDEAVLDGRGEAPGDGTRRTFLVRAGVVAIGSLVVGLGGSLLGRKRREVEAARERLDLPVDRGTVPAGAQLDGLEPWRTPNPEFYRIDTAVVVPAIDVDEWRLRIHGMVEREITVSFQDLLDRQLTEAWVTLCCVSNPVGGDLVGNAWWSGVRIADLLAEAGPLPGADAVLQSSEDGWTCGTPLGALTDDRNALLAIAMNGAPLPLEHGFPVRMVVPGLYGYVSATQWVVDPEVSRFDQIDAFWTTRGWSEQGPVRTQSRIDVPRDNHRVMAGDVRVGGVAWSQHTGIDQVQVRVDGGPWTEMELGTVPSDDTWVQWAGTVQAEAGVHTLAVRATDRSGYEQTGVQRDVVPDGATGWHTIEFTAE